MIKWGLCLGCKDGLTCKSVNVICHIKRIKNKSYMINSIDTEKHLTQLNNFSIKEIKKVSSN